MPMSHRTLEFPAVGSLGRLSAAMCFVVAIGGALTELALCWVWLDASLVERLLVPRLALGAVPVATDGLTRMLGFAVSMLPMAVLIYLLHQAYAVFDAYRLGHVFEARVPDRLRRIGLSLVALAALQPLSTTLLGVVLTMGNPPGQRIVAIGISLDDYLLAAIGGLLVAIGHVMTEAVRLDEDARQIV